MLKVTSGMPQMSPVLQKVQGEQNSAHQHSFGLQYCIRCPTARAFQDMPRGSIYDGRFSYEMLIARLALFDLGGMLQLRAQNPI
jgi:hypothetical protein